MILEKGNMWDVFFDTGAFVITTNPVRRKDGAVVMGRGIALEAKIRYPMLPYDFGYILDHAGNLGFSWINTYEETPIYYFMVKDHWANDASLKIISESAQQMKARVQHDPRRFDLNFPGIGNGKLKREDVLPLLQTLPDNVHVWEYE